MSLSRKLRASVLAVLGVTLSLIVLLAASPAGAASADGGRQGPDPRPDGRMFGVTPAARDGGSRPHRPTPSEFAGTPFATGSNLTYHGGPVMHTNKTYLIYWAPSSHPITSMYQSVINGYFQNVAADSGKATNVYASDTQYADLTGPAQYASANGGSWVDAATAIPDHCSAQYPSPFHVSGCVTDTDLQAEVAHAIAMNTGWDAPGPGVMYFVFTPQNVGSCFSASSTTCAYSYYCAYHSNFTSSGRDVIYANQPYTDTSGVGAAGVCDSGQHPNGDWADATINVASHEHNEAITDPHGNAWFDASGNENGDKCAWNFGTSLGSTGSGSYNQAIGTGKYYIQQEWSNATSSCVLAYGSSGPAQPTITSFTPSSGPVGTSVTITGSGFTGVTGVSFAGTPAAYQVASATSITATVPSGAATGPITVAVPGGSVFSATPFTVSATPAFSLSATPTSRSIARGTSTTYAVTVTGIDGFTGSVSLGVSGLPSRTSTSFSQNPVVAGATSTLTVRTGSRTTRGTYLLTVTGTSGGIAHTVQVTLVVN